MNKDLRAFTGEISWFLNKNDIVEIEENAFELSADFRLKFPKLAKLIGHARKSHLMINNVPHILFAWNNIDGEIFGWLNKMEDLEKTPNVLCEEHKILLKNIGGIQESFNQPEGSLTNNQNFIFIGTKCSFGLGSWDEYYNETCEEENIEPIDHSNLICFVEEANGNMTFYNPSTNDIILFAPDHCFDGITPLDGQPEYTFYKYENIKSFIDYVEEIADEWMEKLPVANNI